MIDTGANVTLLLKDKEHGLTGAKNSRIKIEVADKRCMKGSLDGTAHMHILNIGQEAVKKSVKTATDTGIVLAHKVTTVQNLSRELFSVDNMFLDGCSILLRAPEYENGIPEIHVPASKSSTSFSIPLRYDYEEGGFWLDYVMHDSSDKGRRNAMAASERWRQQQTTALTKNIPAISETQAAVMTRALRNCGAVKHQRRQDGTQKRQKTDQSQRLSRRPRTPRMRGQMYHLCTSKRVCKGHHTNRRPLHGSAQRSHMGRGHSDVGAQV
jgi:hypothetical protein